MSAAGANGDIGRGVDAVYRGRARRRRLAAAIMLRYVLPNVFSPIVVYATTLMGLMIVVGSG